jgi:4,5-dihydroxyphthalate decarboxylase
VNALTERPRVRLAIADHDLNRALIDGRVRPEGIELDITSGTDDGALHALLREGAVDACEYSMAGYLVAKGQGRPFCAIPAFPNRKFRLSYIFCNTSAGIREPRDLEGKRVAVPSWAMTACVWVRGALAHSYGVDLTRIRWLSRSRPEPGTLPPGIEVGAIESSGNLDSLLVSGQVDAVIQADVPPSVTKGDPAVHRLFRDYKAEDQAYYRRTGIFPISHAVVMTEEIVRRAPTAPLALLDAFRRSRDDAFHRIEEQQILSLSWASALLEEQRALMGPNYWAYNVEDNRLPLQTIITFAHEQGLIPHEIPVEDLFLPEAAAAPGA